MALIPKKSILKRTQIIDKKRIQAENARQEELDQNICVVGYASKLFRDDAKALSIHRGEHLIPWQGDKSLMIDRYDVRGHLTDLDDLQTNSWNRHDEHLLSNEEIRIEAICDKERYLALHKDLIEEQHRQEEELKRLNEAIASDEGTYTAVGFSYGGGNDEYDPMNPTEDETETREENTPPAAPAEPERAETPEPDEEPFIAPEELSVPKGVEPPATLKTHLIIEKTAMFVANQGPQMEIIVKAKQSNNPQFAFMNFEHYLNPYYKHLVKMIKSKRYRPKPLTQLDQNSGKGARRRSRSNSHHSDDEDDEDENDSSGYLHPSLLGKPKAAPTPPAPETQVAASETSSSAAIDASTESMYSSSSAPVPPGYPMDPRIQALLSYMDPAALVAAGYIDPHTGMINPYLLSQLPPPPPPPPDGADPSTTMPPYMPYLDPSYMAAPPPPPPDPSLPPTTVPINTTVPPPIIPPNTSVPPPPLLPGGPPPHTVSSAHPIGPPPPHTIGPAPPDRLPPHTISSAPPTARLPPHTITSAPPPDILPPHTMASSHPDRLPPHILTSAPPPDGLPPHTMASSHPDRLPPHILTSAPPPDGLPPHTMASAPPPDGLPPHTMASAPPPDRLPPHSGTPPPHAGPLPPPHTTEAGPAPEESKMDISNIIPPPPDLQPIIDKLAKYVAKNGEDFEASVRSKADQRFEFLLPWHPFNGYYMHMKILYLREMGKDVGELDAKVEALSQVKKAGPVSFSIKYKKPEEKELERKSALPIESSSDSEEEEEKERTPQLSWAPNRTSNLNIPRDSMPLDIRERRGFIPIDDRPMDPEDWRERYPDHDVPPADYGQRPFPVPLPDDRGRKLPIPPEELAFRNSKHKLQDRLAMAARDKMANKSKERVLQMERRKKAAMFLSMIKDRPQAADVPMSSDGGGSPTEVIDLVDDNDDSPTSSDSYFHHHHRRHSRSTSPPSHYKHHGSPPRAFRMNRNRDTDNDGKSRIRSRSKSPTRIDRSPVRKRRHISQSPSPHRSSSLSPEYSRDRYRSSPIEEIDLTDDTADSGPTDLRSKVRAMLAETRGMFDP